MPKKYHINTSLAPLDFDYIHKFRITRGENCINCGRCAKVCIYEARRMAEPNTVACRNCFRCIQECPRGALEKSLDGEFAMIGGAYWKPDMLISLWKQAEDGKVPVSGAGYRGPFTGPGFDSMWTDMSEIVRPTRDGIHGREYISTSVELGRKLDHLTFGSEGQLISRVPDTVGLPIPLLFDMPTKNLSSNVKVAMVKAAAEIGTCVILPVADVIPDMKEYYPNIIPHLMPTEIEAYKATIKKVRLVSIEYSDSVASDYRKLRNNLKNFSPAIPIIRVPAVKNIESIVSKLAHEGAEIVHIVADYCGQQVGGSAAPAQRHLKDIIRSTHQRLIEERIRDEITIVVSGGIGMAEHVTKAMLCGADLVAIDIPLVIAVGARLYEEPEKKLIFPEGVENIPVTVITRRLVNLAGAWHSQILEMMGAMGIREARRLRGETGRAIFFEEIDKDTFGKLF
jgi:ferredoxin